MLDGSIQLIAPDVPIRDAPIPIEQVRRTLHEPLGYIKSFQPRPTTTSHSSSGYVSRASSVASSLGEVDEERKRAVQEVLDREIRKSFLSRKKINF